MEKDFILQEAARIGIDVQQVIREEAELIVLKALFESVICDALIFKGGTALRLIYNSPRFSEDLDFSTTTPISARDFKTVIHKIIASDSRFSLKSMECKYSTHLAEIRIKETWQNIALSLKIEISRRPESNKIKDRANALAKSSVTNLTILTTAFTLKRILKDKLRLLKVRKMPRDIFDIWFICQKTGVEFNQKKFGYPKRKIRQELRKFLPSSYYPVVEELEARNA
ncbi:MAG: nucleotidyl transferase AbiEii/AbiGii toxin family protein [Candidatus Omnitrophota bacterium]